MANWLNIAAKSAAVMAATASLYDVNANGVRVAKNKSSKNYADDFIAQQIGASKLNYPSEKAATIKNWMLDFKFPYKVSEFVDSLTGYTEGAIKAIGHNFATLGFSALAFFSGSKHPRLQKAGLFGLGISVAWDFLKNCTNAFERTDWLRK